MTVLKGTDRDKYFQFICLFSAITVCVYGFVMAEFNFPTASVMAFSSSGIYGLFYFFHHRTLNENIKTAFFIFAYLILSSYTFYFGTESGIEAWFFTIGCLGLALFPVADRRLLLSVFCTVLTLTIVYSLAPRQGAINDPAVLHLFRLIMIPLSLGSALLSVYVIQKINYKIEKMAKEGYEELSLLVQSLNDMVFQLSADLKYERIWVSHENQILGPQVNLIGKSITQVLPSEISEKAIYFLELAKKTRVATEFEFSLKLEGKTYYLRARSQCIFLNDSEARGFLVLISDVTEQTQLRMELEVKRSQMIQSAKLSSLGEMAAGIAHEINNPLAIISAQAERMAAKAEKNELDQQFALEKSTKIIQTVGRIANIVRGMKNLSRNSERDQESIENLTQICLEAASLSHEKLKNLGIELVIDLPEMLLVTGRPAELGQVVLNLISNSIDALSDSGFPRVLRIAGKVEERIVFLEVSDNGPGISPLHVEKIMEPFFTTKEIGKGTGLGLSVAKGIAEKFRGQLIIKSLRQPTVFSLRLPEAQMEDNTVFKEPLA
ncbi:MAG: ATP-binding protein [Proteobacteria bacterium]|jgi:C4-dicarboxylate-specific signal transduction histidine kinase|nr:ATP-binding protein [Pseudomonadota bacterium]